MTAPEPQADHSPPPAPTVIEVSVPPSHHHTLELLQQVHEHAMAHAQAKAHEAQQAYQAAQDNLAWAAARMLVDTAKDRLPNGEIPKGSRVRVEFGAKLIAIEF